MTFKVGHKKIKGSGRQKGTKNKKPPKEKILSFLEQAQTKKPNANPFLFMAKTMKTGETEAIRLAAAKEYATYLEGKKTSQEIKHEFGNIPEVIIPDFDDD